MEKLLCSQLVPGTSKQFLGLVLTAARRLLARTKSATQAKRQHGVLFGRRLLIAHIALQAPYIHCNRIACSKDTQYVLDVHPPFVPF
jgi:hypothetical protein